MDWCAHLLNAKPGLLGFGLLHDFRACKSGICGNWLHVHMLAVNVPWRLVSIGHNNDVVTTTEGVLRQGRRQEKATFSADKSA